MDSQAGNRQSPPPQDTELRSSLTLLERAQAGDRAALESLITRYLPRLKRWASGRLPRWARDLADTQDLVQEAVFQTFRKIDRFEPPVVGDPIVQRSPEPLRSPVERSKHLRVSSQGYAEELASADTDRHGNRIGRRMNSPRPAADQMNNQG